jgi:hypothetical protein
LLKSSAAPRQGPDLREAVVPQRFLQAAGQAVKQYKPPKRDPVI